MGELFNSMHEWQLLIAEQLIDYIRVPFTTSPLNGGWGEIRLRDGTVIKQ
jgi:hypothetical protein